MKRDNLIPIATVRRADEGLELAIERRKIMVVQGPPGLGKTRWAEEQARRLGALYVRMRAHWTDRTAFAAMVRTLEGWEDYDADRHGVHQLYARLVRELRDHPRVIFIDEIDYLLERKRGHRLLHSLRDIFDESGCPLVLISIAHLGRPSRWDMG